MEKVNYIVQLNGAFERFHNDDRIKQGHITLYLAFFQKWNREYFKKTITINRRLVMEGAKIRSKTTYHNHLRNLDEWGYLVYFPSYHPARWSRTKMSIFGSSSGTGSGTTSVQKLASSVPEPGQNLVPSYKHKTKENLNKMARPKNEQVVLDFFKENKWPAIEGKKFYTFYQAQGWRPSKVTKIRNWKESARNFVEKGYKIDRESTGPIFGLVSNLRTNNDKDYGMPF